MTFTYEPSLFVGLPFGADPTKRDGSFLGAVFVILHIWSILVLFKQNCPYD